MHTRLLKLIPILVVMALPSSGFGAQGAGKHLYRWTDDQGNVHYSDQVPADQARPAKAILNERGMTVDQIEAAKTAQQIAEEKRKQREQQEQQRREKEQLAYDRMLLNTFHSETDIVHARDSRILAVENLIHVSQNAIDHLEQQQHELVKQAAQAERAGRTVPKAVSEEILKVRRQIRDANRYIEEKRGEQAEIRKQYEQDIQRWRTIKAEMSQR